VVVVLYKPVGKVQVLVVVVQARLADLQAVQAVQEVQV
jgi:hypothetical protein